MQTGPWALCGATWMWCAWAIAQIFLSSEMPPHVTGSGWMIWAAVAALCGSLALAIYDPPAVTSQDNP